MLHVSLPVVCVLDARHEKSIVEISCLLRACHEERVDLESIAYEFTLVILNDKVKRIGELRLESSHKFIIAFHHFDRQGSCLKKNVNIILTLIALFFRKIYDKFVENIS